MFWSNLILTFSTRFFRSDWKKTISASSIIQTSFDSKFHWLLYEGWLKQISWKIDDLYSKNLRWCALANLFFNPYFSTCFLKMDWQKTICASCFIQTPFDCKFHWLSFYARFTQIARKIDDWFSKNLRWCGIADSTLHVSTRLGKIQKKCFFLVIPQRVYSVSTLINIDYY